MKKILAVFALAALFCTTTVAFADTQLPCDQTPAGCGNGPIVAEPAGVRFLKAGDEDCPSWYPSVFGYACVTFRPLGAPFIPLQ